MGAFGLPDPLGISSPLQVVPHLIRIESSGPNRPWLFTARTEFQGDSTRPLPFLDALQST
jgi:hypothetical protein